MKNQKLYKFELFMVESLQNDYYFLLKFFELYALALNT